MRPGWQGGGGLTIRLVPAHALQLWEATMSVRTHTKMLMEHRSAMYAIAAIVSRNRSGESATMQCRTFLNCTA